MATDYSKEFLTRLGFQVDAFALRKFLGSLNVATVKTLALNTAVIAAGAGIFAFVQGIAKKMKTLDLLAQELRSTTAELDNFLDAVNVFGLSDAQAEELLRNFNKAVQDTNLGLGRAKKVFEKFGISVKDSTGKIRPTLEILAELQKKTKDLGRGEKIRVLERLGISHDAAIYRVLNTDLSEVTRTIEDMEKRTGFDFDLAMKNSLEFSKNFRDFKDEINLFKMTIGKIFEVIAVKLMPKFGKGVKSMTKSWEAFRNYLIDNSGKIIDAVMPIIELIHRISSAFLKLASFVLQIVGIIVSAILKINSAMGGWLGYIGLAIAAWKLLNLSFLKSPLGIIISLSVGILALADDLATFLRGGESFFDWSNKAIFTIGTLIFGVASYKATVVAITAATRAWAVAQAAFNIIMSLNPIGLIVIGVSALIAAGYILYKQWDKIKALFNSLFERFDKYWGKVKSFFSLAGSAVGKSGNFGSNYGAPLAPTPAAISNINNNSNQNAKVSQSTVINVNGSGNPAQTAKDVAGLQDRVNGNMVRNFAGATR